MSPCLQFRGPARQRGAIGLMAAGTLALALGFMLLVIDSGRLYLEQRKLQRVADTAALEAVTRDGNCLSGASATAYATQSATRNGFTVNADNTLTVSCGTLQIGADHLRAFSADPKKSAAVQVIATRTVATSVAAGIGALLSGGPPATWLSWTRSRQHSWPCRRTWTASTSTRPTTPGPWSSTCWASSHGPLRPKTPSASPGTWPTVLPPPFAQSHC